MLFSRILSYTRESVSKFNEQVSKLFFKTDTFLEICFQIYVTVKLMSIVSTLILLRYGTNVVTCAIYKHLTNSRYVANRFSL